MNTHNAQHWQPSELVHEHVAAFDAAIGHVEAQSFMYPADGRMHVAQALMSMRGKGTSVHMTGTAGSGKTLFGDLVLGEHNRVTIEPTDTQESLVGYPNPINAAELIPGRFKVDPRDPRFYFNEVAQLRNKGPLHAFWDGEQVLVNGIYVPLEYAARYATSNFPDGIRNHPMDGAMKSRQAVEILSGDSAREQSMKIHGRDVNNIGTKKDTNGVLPSAEVSQSLRTALGNAYPLGADYPAYISDVLDLVDGSPLLTIIDSNKADGRLSEGWQQAVRAMRLAKNHTGLPDGEVATGNRIDGFSAARAGALVLPTQVELSQAGRARLRSVLDKPTVSPLEEAIALRHALAATCFNLYVVKMDKPMPDAQIAQYFGNFMAKHAYANPNGISEEVGIFVRDVLASEGPKVTKAPTTTEVKGVANGKFSKFRRAVTGNRA